MRALPPIVRVAALTAAAAVAAGAYGAHGATGPAADWLKTGALYGMVHAVAAIALVLGGVMGLVPWLLLGGSLLFSGSLYVLALGGPHLMVFVTPLGGLGMIAGWIWLALRR